MDPPELIGRIDGPPEYLSPRSAGVWALHHGADAVLVHGGLLLGRQGRYQPNPITGPLLPITLLVAVIPGPRGAKVITAKPL